MHISVILLVCSACRPGGPPESPPHQSTPPCPKRGSVEVVGPGGADTVYDACSLDIPVISEDFACGSSRVILSDLIRLVFELDADDVALPDTPLPSSSFTWDQEIQPAALLAVPTGENGEMEQFVGGTVTVRAADADASEDTTLDVVADRVCRFVAGAGTADSDCRSGGAYVITLRGVRRNLGACTAVLADPEYVTLEGACAFYAAPIVCADVPPVSTP